MSLTTTESPEYQPESSGELTAEERFYLPWNDSGLTKEFGERETPDQKSYARLCARAHDVLANRCLNWIENSEKMDDSRVSLSEQLYREAAKLRRAIEWRSRENGDDIKQRNIAYGIPLVFNSSSAVAEECTPTSQRYAKFFEPAKQRISAFLAQYDDAKGKAGVDALIERLFGKNYTAEVVDLPGKLSRIRIFERNAKNDPKTLIAQIAYAPMKNFLFFVHASYGEREKLLRMADAPLKRLIKEIREHQHKEWDKSSRAQFWKDLADFSLHLYHAAPLRYGSQTATLTILAGLCKASGLTPAPGILETDHFLDAEIIPYREYINSYQTNFGKNFVENDHSITHPIVVNTSFIRKGIAFEAKYFNTLEETPKARADAFIHHVLWAPSGHDKNPKIPKVKTCKLDKTGRMHISVEPEFQTALDDAIDFIGHDEIAKIAGLSLQRAAAKTRR